MTDKHRDPEYIRNAGIVRARVRRDWKHGTEVRCWRTGAPIEPGQKFDVGHIDPNGGHGISNLAPETVRSNRSEGGRRGAALTNARRSGGAPRQPTVRRASSTGLAPW
ncbi:hypothetical protein ASF87_16680 [Microbacterium sp. Leaf161]|uniref:hypothetical protein n=1 Tax=Microbacterium sp. Leaf161 TaxID=1736281 RepID=UPI0006FC18F5|nr:hypothetical protein [Microbacterium sp. Leaf161]KQR43425.1 hypothetical protein ASF87_16680 [Microbacterium sp. Leaf161]